MDQYQIAVNRMILWRDLQTMSLFVVVAMIPVLQILEIQVYYYIPAYAGVLLVYIICEFQRTRYRRQARSLYNTTRNNDHGQ